MPDGNHTKPRKLERRIRALCSEVLATNDEYQLRKVCAELRKTISDHIEAVRIKVIELKLKELSTTNKLNELSSVKKK